MRKQQIDQLECAFSSYHNNTISKKEIIEFVNQIDIFCTSDWETRNTLKQNMFNILANIDFLDRASISEELEHLLQKMQTFVLGRSVIIKYGELEDSSSRLIHYLDHNAYVKSIHSALKEDHNTLLFIDDGVNSGHQIISIFQEYMGLKKLKRKTSEHHVKELSSCEKAKIKAIRIVIGFIYFNRPVEKYILNELKKIGLSNVQIVYNKSFSPKLSDRSDLFVNQAQKEVFISFLEKIGSHLLQSDKLISSTEYKERWSKKRVKRSALGYNNAQQLVVFEYNIPTYTITALWLSGDLSGITWKGLFSRSD